MRSWLDGIEDTRALTAVYGDRVPAPIGVRISEVAIYMDRRLVRLIVDLPEFPAEPPAKWRDFNTVQVTLLLSEIAGVRIDGRPVGDTADLELVRQDRQVALSLVGAGLDVEIRCGSVFLQKISAYQQGTAAQAVRSGQPAEDPRDHL